MIYTPAGFVLFVVGAVILGQRVFSTRQATEVEQGHRRYWDDD